MNRSTLLVALMLVGCLCSTVVTADWFSDMMNRYNRKTYCCGGVFCYQNEECVRIGGRCRCRSTNSVMGDDVDRPYHEDDVFYA